MTDSYNIFDIALPPSPDGPEAKMLYMAFPDIEEVFSVDELLALWADVEEASESGAGPSQPWVSVSGAGPSQP